MGIRMNEGKVWPVSRTNKRIVSKVQKESEKNRLWIIVTIPLFFILLSKLASMYEYFPSAISENGEKCEKVGGMLWLTCLGAHSLGSIVMLALLGLSALFICLVASVASRVAVTEIGRKIYLALVPFTIVLTLLTVLKMLGVYF